MFFLIIINYEHVNAESKKFEYSTVVDVPDLSFFDHIYSGLDILEQMDFKFLNNKNIGLFCNHTAVNRNNIHLLDLIGKNKNNIFTILLMLNHPS